MVEPPDFTNYLINHLRNSLHPVTPDNATLLRLENMTSRVAKNPQQFTIVRAVDVIIYLKYEHLKRRIEEIVSVDNYDYVRHEYITHPMDS